MSDRPAICQHDHVRSFLAGELNERETAEFETHLAECHTCRTALDDAVANEAQWESMRQSLLAETTGLSHSDTNRNPAQSQERESTIEFYRSMLGPSDDPKMLGRIDAYEIVGVLGSGGMGVVFKAFDAKLNRYVAVKMLAPHIASSPVARKRFSREAQATAAIAHQNVIAIHGVAQWQDTPYLVMPYLANVSMQQRLSTVGSLNVRETLRIGIQVAAALSAAHTQGLIHRDVKPANILMEQGVERVVLTDFGLACALDDVRLTQADTLIGTPQYMSPEQASDLVLDPRSDLFSLGSVLYEAVTGRPAFHAATSYGVVRKIIDTEPPAAAHINQDVPAWLSEIIAKLMAKSPEDRYQSAASVQELLQACLAHTEQPSTTPLPQELGNLQDTPTFPVTINRNFAMLSSLVLCIGAIAYFAFPPSQGTFARQDIPHEDLPLEFAIDDETQFTATPIPQGKKSKSGKYDSFNEAYGIAVALHNSRKYAEAQKPFEAAFELTDDVKKKIRVKQALMSCYRRLPDFEPMRKAVEYVISNSDRSAERSITRTSFLGFTYQRGQIDNLIKRYEKVLTKKPEDYVALYLLAELYSSGDRNPKAAIDIMQRLSKVEEKLHPNDKKMPSEIAQQAIQTAREKAKLARQYVQSGQPEKGAKIYAEIAPLDKTTHAWNLKEAASAYLKANNNKLALEIAIKADKAEPEARNDQLCHFFHRNLGDIFMKLQQPAKAIRHYEIAVEKTTIEGYVKDTKASLVEAKEAAGKTK